MDRLDEFDSVHMKLQSTIRQHSLRVGVTSFLLAYASNYPEMDGYGLSGQELKMALVNGGRYHDLGKLNIPKNLYRKDWVYSEEQMAVIREHPLYTGRILNEYADVLFAGEAQKQIVMDMGRYHHERYDGGGYPFGLKGDEIPLAAGLCAAGNDLDHEVWIPYKTKNVDRSIDKLAENKGTVYSPQAIECVLAARAWLNKMYEHKNRCMTFIYDVLCDRLP